MEKPPKGDDGLDSLDLEQLLTGLMRLLGNSNAYSSYAVFNSSTNLKECQATALLTQLLCLSVRLNVPMMRLRSFL